MVDLSGRMRVELFHSPLGHEEIESAMDALQEPRLGSGRRIAALEHGLTQILGVRRAVAAGSYSSTLRLALWGLGIGPGDEVLCSPLASMRAVSAILLCGGRPVFVDAEPDTGIINAELVEAAITPQTRALVPTHLYGQMADMAMLREIADRSRLKLIEDAAHCLEGRREGVRPGQLSDAACLSFDACSPISSGRGGAVALNDAELAERLLKLRQLGMSHPAGERGACLEQGDMELLGLDCEMDELRAALLLPQLRNVEKSWERRELICAAYEQALARIPGVFHPRVKPGSRSARGLFTIWVDARRRDVLLNGLRERGVGAGVFYRPLHLYTHIRKLLDYKPGDFLVAESLGARTITLPLHSALTDEQVDYVIEQLRGLMR